MIRIDINELINYYDSLTKHIDNLTEDIKRFELKINSIEDYWNGKDFDDWYINYSSIISNNNDILDNLILYKDSVKRLIDRLNEIFIS